jgi:hypothetical protein
VLPSSWPLFNVTNPESLTSPQELYNNVKLIKSKQDENKGYNKQAGNQDYQAT